MNWNPVLNKFIEIKRKAEEAGISLWNYDKSNESCLEYWCRKLQIQEYLDLIHFLVLNEYNDFLLVRYGNYAEILSGDEGVTLDSFWDLYDGIYRECRSVVLDIKKECLVLAPFRKFRNLNEGEECTLEKIQERMERASCVEISDKMDGSMQCAGYYEGQIVMAGSQSLNRENSWRLDDGYRMLMEKEGYQRMLKDHPDKTFIFEYISEKDAHVVKYDVEGLFLIGVRRLTDGGELSYKEVFEYAERYDVPSTKVFDKTLDEILKELDDKSSDEAEGFVTNIDGYKVKIKYNDYVHMHRMLSALSSINLIIESVAENYYEDLLAKVPLAYQERVKKVGRLVSRYKKKTEEEIEEIFEKAPKEDRKEFMIWVEENVRKEIRGFVRNKYLGREYNVLKKSDRYLKLKEMGVEDYKGVFEEDE